MKNQSWLFWLTGLAATTVFFSIFLASSGGLSFPLSGKDRIIVLITFMSFGIAVANVALAIRLKQLGLRKTSSFYLLVTPMILAGGLQIIQYLTS